MPPLEVWVVVTSIVGAIAYTPHGSIGEKVQEPLLTEALLREVVERMGRELGDVPSYLDYQPTANERRLAMMIRANKDLEIEQPDYDSLIDGNPNPSLRDQEYLQHSSLWGKQFIAGGAGEDGQHLKPSGLIPTRNYVKTDSILPAYCNPPNPCPVGYTEDQGCITEFDNTAAFCREYQQAQQCMCDGEHMFSCSSDSEDMDPHFPERSNGVTYGAAKYEMNDENPFLTGDRLPIAAKKGFDVISVE